MSEAIQEGGAERTRPEMTPARLEARMQASLALLLHGTEDMEAALRAWVGDGGPESPAGKFRAYAECTPLDLTKTDELSLRAILTAAGIVDAGTVH